MAVRFVAIRRLAVAIALCIVCSSGLFAQVVHGRVLSAADSSPIAGAIVELRDSTGSLIQSALTSGAGAFAIAARSTGRSSLRVLRIGYQPFDGGRVAADTSTRPITILWSAPPIMLAAQRVRGARTCRISIDSGTIVVRVWEEARKALLASLLADERGSLDIARLNLSRTLDSSGRTVRQQRVVAERAQSFHAYSSLAPDTLALRGYVREDASGVSFYAPDAAALLSDAFVGSHCFAVREGTAEHIGEVGLSFEPSMDREQNRDADRDARVDIQGTFWMERRTWQLRQLTFTYVGLPQPAATAMNGGFVDFAALADGAWIVSNWRLRLPRLAAAPRITDGGARRVTLAPTSRTVVAIEEAGGVVVTVRRDGAVLLTTALPSLEVVLVVGSTIVPYGVPTVTLEGTGLSVDADSAGRARFPSLIEGRYSVRVRYPMLDALGLAPLQRTVDMRAGNRSDSIKAPPPEDVLRQACGVDAVRNKTAVIFGVLADSLGQPTSGVVHVTWPASAKVLASRKGDDQLAWVDQMRGVLVGADGRYKLCGVPRQGLVVRAEGAHGVAAAFTRLYETEPMRRLDLALAHSAAVVRDEVVGAPTLAYLEIRVVRSDGDPAAGVSLEVTDANGRRGRVRTDAAGRALLMSQPIGVARVRASRTGGEDVTIETSLSVGRNVVVITLSSP
jgi:hypothetical protein